MSKLALVFVACTLLIVPSAYARNRVAHTHWLAEAEQEAAFGSEGRIQALPLRTQISTPVFSFLSAFRTDNLRDIAAYRVLRSVAQRAGIQMVFALAAGILVVAVGLAVSYRVIPFPRTAVCLVVACLVGMWWIWR